MNELKVSCFIKHDVEFKEYYMQNYVYNLGIVNVPKIFDYNKKTKTMIMEKINNDNISDVYGEDMKNISDELYDKIRNIIKTLYDNGVEYIDVTGYNFIEHEEKIWIIDFEHAKKIGKQKNEFVQTFISGKKEWNIDFL